MGQSNGCCFHLPPLLTLSPPSPNGPSVTRPVCVRLHVRPHNKLPASPTGNSLPVKKKHTEVRSCGRLCTLSHRYACKSLALTRSRVSPTNSIIPHAHWQPSAAPLAGPLCTYIHLQAAPLQTSAGESFRLSVFSVEVKKVKMVEEETDKLLHLSVYRATRTEKREAV